MEGGGVGPGRSELRVVRRGREDDGRGQLGDRGTPAGLPPSKSEIHAEIAGVAETRTGRRRSCRHRPCFPLRGKSRNGRNSHPCLSPRGAPLRMGEGASCGVPR